ncbi:MAG: hypothetical protein WC188_03630 [Candidatus Caldatribacteriota bacterium]|jgi:hypothetical protein
MFLCEILIEQNVQPVPIQQAPPSQQVPVQVPDYNDSEDIEFSDEVPAEENPETSQFQAILPLKKYYLIRRLEHLKSKLENANIENTDFNIIMKFINNLSYDAIVSLSLSIIPVIEDQLARTSNA